MKRDQPAGRTEPRLQDQISKKQQRYKGGSLLKLLIAPSLIRWVARVVIGIAAILSVLGGSGVYYLLEYTVPDYQAEIILEGLSARVQVVRSRHAVPHILADNMSDAYLALGYVHAQDRLWQMEIMRRAGAGRLAEILGQQAFGIDHLMRTLGIYRLAESSIQTLTLQAHSALKAYAQGVNLYLDQGPLPLEFYLFWYRPEPWQPADSMVWGKLMALDLSGSAYTKTILRAQLAEMLSPETLEVLFMPENPIGFITLERAGISRASSGGDSRDDADASLQPKEQPDVPPEPNPAGEADRLAGPIPGELSQVRIPAGISGIYGDSLHPNWQAGGSNAWVVSGKYTVSGFPVLANDPHLRLESPVLWYLARIDTPELSLVGATVPGMPFHVIADNGSIAWGFTNTHGRAHDVFVEKIDQSEPSRYLTPEGWRRFQTRQEVIVVKHGQQQTVITRATRHGPVISDLQGITPPAGYALALGFTGLSDNDTSVQALYALNRAGSWSEFLAAASLHQAPQQNVTYADRKGNIGFISAGRIPIRPAELWQAGDMPVKGWTGKADWLGTTSLESWPQLFNPPAGTIVNANNAVIGAPYPYPITDSWPPSQRARRIEQLLAGPGDHSLDQAQAILKDVVSLAAQDLLPLMVDIPAGEHPQAERALELLQNWNGQMTRDAAEALIFHTWLERLRMALLRQVALRHGQNSVRFEHYSRSLELEPNAILHMLASGQDWCGNQGCPHVLTTTLDRALEDLSGQYGKALNGWYWGKAHRAPLAHPILSQLPLVGSWFRHDIPTDGDSYTVNRGLFLVGQPFTQIQGAGLRVVFDLSPSARHRFMIATGQSGNPFSPFYADLLWRWRDGEMIELPQAAIGDGIPAEQTVAVTSFTPTR